MYQKSIMSYFQGFIQTEKFLKRIAKDIEARYRRLPRVTVTLKTTIPCNTFYRYIPYLLSFHLKRGIQLY